MDWVHIGLLGLVGVVGGAFGAMMGVGGGALIVPLLTLAVGMPVHAALGVSLVAVAGTACSASATYTRSRFTNIRLGLLLETTAAIGAILEALLASVANANWLAVLFAGSLLFTSYNMFRRRNGTGGATEIHDIAKPGGTGVRASLGGSYRNEASGEVTYGVSRLKIGLGGAGLAGVLAGLLGIGGGLLKVPVLHLVMRVPMKATIGTSTFMMGITAVAGAFIYYQQGYLDPLAAAPVLLGVFLGVQLGVRVVRRARGVSLRTAFAVVLLLVAVLMLIRAAGVEI